MNDTFSEPIESLRLVSDEYFSFVHHSMQERIPRKERIPKKDNGDHGESNRAASEHSAKLLNGLLYKNMYNRLKIQRMKNTRAPGLREHKISGFHSLKLILLLCSNARRDRDAGLDRGISGIH